MNMDKPRITHERLLELVEYDPATGMFFWRATGKVAGFNRDNGYRLLMLDRKKYPAQKVAWFYVKGEWPERIIRFKDGDGQNCRIDNLTYGQFHYVTKAGRNAYDRNRRARKPEHLRRNQIKRDFGLSLEQVEAMEAAQGGVCACCKQPERQTYRGRQKPLGIDHNHETGEIRDLLCASCNLMIGYSREDPEILRAAAAYLERHSAGSPNVIPMKRKEA